MGFKINIIIKGEFQEFKSNFIANALKLQLFKPIKPYFRNIGTNY